MSNVQSQITTACCDAKHNRRARDCLDFGLWTLDFGHFYTAWPFQFPRRKTNALTIARVENAIMMARKTPRGPSPKTTDNTYASGSSHNQNTNKLMIVGVQVAPAPLNDCVKTIPYA